MIQFQFDSFKPRHQSTQKTPSTQKKNNGVTLKEIKKYNANSEDGDELIYYKNQCEIYKHRFEQWRQKAEQLKEECDDWKNKYEDLKFSESYPLTEKTGQKILNMLERRSETTSTQQNVSKTKKSGTSDKGIYFF